jgi:hypothetical protein
LFNCVKGQFLSDCFCCSVGISTGTQTTPIQQNEFVNGHNYPEESNEIVNRKLQQQALFLQQQQQQQLQNSGRTASQTSNTYDYYYQQAKPQPASNYQKTHLNSQK